MKKDNWQDWIGSELRQPPVEPASEEFYRGVWRRINTENPSLSPQKWAPASIGLACWRAVPVLSALVLLIALFGWFYPPDFGGQTTISAEAYALDADTAPSNSELFYQIMHETDAAGSEAEP